MYSSHAVFDITTGKALGASSRTRTDLKKQQAARAAINGRLAGVGPSSAIVTIDPKNGDILAMASTQAYGRGKGKSTFIGLDVVISVSIGIAVSDGSESAEDLLGDADTAMFRAKQRRRTEPVVREPNSMRRSFLRVLRVAPGEYRGRFGVN